MKAQTEVLAIVLAIGDHAGTSRKNLRILRGHPLLAYSITAGLAAEASGVLSTVLARAAIAVTRRAAEMMIFAIALPPVTDTQLD